MYSTYNIKNWLRLWRKTNCMSETTQVLCAKHSWVWLFPLWHHRWCPHKILKFIYSGIKLNFLLVYTGWAMQCGGFFFINRKWEEDKKIFTDMLDYFVNVDHKTQVMILSYVDKYLKSITVYLSNLCKLKVAQNWFWNAWNSHSWFCEWSFCMLCFYALNNIFCFETDYWFLFQIYHNNGVIGLIMKTKALFYWAKPKL